MVGDFFGVLYGEGVVGCEIDVDVAQGIELFGRDTGELGNTRLCEGYKIFHLHLNTVSDKSELGEKFVQTLAFAAVTAVDGRDGGKLRKFHNSLIIN